MSEHKLYNMACGYAEQGIKLLWFKLDKTPGIAWSREASLDPVKLKEWFYNIEPGQRRIGFKSGQVRKRNAEIRKAMTQVYQDILKNPDLDLDDAIIKIIGQKNSASVSMMKEIREALEGNKIKLASDDAAPLNVTITPVKVKE